jgi:hypothetical protein
MGWATQYIGQLQQEQMVQFRPRGNSMSGKIDSGQLVTVRPIGERKIEIGDIVLCKVNGVQYLHLVKAVQGDRFLIGNNRGRINGWTQRRNIFGIVTEIAK